MATEAQAKRALALYEKELRAGGAHALSVESAKGAKTFSVVVWLKPEKLKESALPSSLKIEDQGSEIKVPLEIRESKPFQLE